MFKKLSILWCLLLSSSFLWAESDWVEGIDVIQGEHYELIVPPLPGGIDGRVEVVELFWYGCPHCDRIDPLISDWSQNKKADYIDFSHLPAIFNNPDWHLHATAFYVAKSLGVDKKIHKPFFDALHRQRRPLKSVDQLADFFADYGVDKKKFKRAFKSFSVKAKVSRAADLTKKYGISGVPVVIVDGKYRVDGPMAGSYENLLRIVDFLAAKEYKAKN